MPDKKPMTPEEFAQRMAEIEKSLENRERGADNTHMEADELMCDLLRQLGYEEGVEVVERMDKWYD